MQGLYTKYDIHAKIDAMRETHKQLRKQILSNSVQWLQERDWLYPHAIHSWIEEYINKGCKAITGYGGRQVAWMGSSDSYKVCRIEGQLAIVMQSKFGYLRKSGKPPQAKALNRVLPNIKVRNLDTDEEDIELYVEVTINLDMWPNIMFGALHQCALGAVLAVDMTQELRSLWKESAVLILARYYPHLTFDYLSNAIHLDQVTDDCDDFVFWLGSQTHAGVHCSVEMPEILYI